MKKFLCYDTNDAASGKIDVDSRGMLKSTGSSVQADWNENDSSSPAYILNKPENLGGGVAWFAASNSISSGALDVRTGRNWENGVPATGTEIVNAFESGICRFNLTLVSCCGSSNLVGTMIGYCMSSSSVKCFISGSISTRFTKYIPL